MVPLDMPLRSIHPDKVLSLFLLFAALLSSSTPWFSYLVHYFLLPSLIQHPDFFGCLPPVFCAPFPLILLSLTWLPPYVLASSAHLLLYILSHLP